MPARARIGFAAFAIAVAASPAAQADHGAVGAPAPQRSSNTAGAPGTSVSMSLSTTDFEIDDFAGRFYTAAALGEYWRGAYGARLRVPVHTLSMTGDDTRHTGVGDVELGAAWLARRAATSVIEVGAATYLPTGDSSTGMGAGAPALAPSVRATTALPAALAVDVQAAALINMSRGQPTTFIEQRADAELRAGTALSWQTGRARVSGHAFLVIPVAPDDARGDVFVNLGPAITVTVSRRCWLDASVDVPVRDDRAYDLRASLGLGCSLADARPTSACRSCAAP